MNMMTLHYILTATSLTVGMIVQSKLNVIENAEDMADKIPVIGNMLANIIGMAK